MNGGVDLVLSPETLLRIFVAMLYIPAGLLAFWKIIPALSPPAKRLACIVLALQLLVIIVAIEQQSASGFAYWLWHLDLEWNIPSILSSSQLAFIGGLALAAAWVYRDGAVLHRLYLVALAVFFIILGLEEFFAWKESITETAWRTNYAILGAAVFIATTWITAHTPKDERAPLIILMIGFALLAIGGGIIDMAPEICGDLGILRLDGCFYFYRSPEEVVEVLGAWVVLLALLCRLSRGTAPMSRRGWWLLHLFPLVWILFLIRYSPVSSFEIQPPARAARCASNQMRNCTDSKRMGAACPLSHSCSYPMILIFRSWAFRCILLTRSQAIPLPAAKSTRIAAMPSGQGGAATSPYTRRR